MKRILILLCLPLMTLGQPTVNIPDANFKAYLVGNTAINTNGDTEIQLSEAASFNGSINCNFMNISDLTGIEDFTALTNLDCRNNQLTNLNLTHNHFLTSLICIGNQLTTLDLTQNTSLNNLFCQSNQLTSLDLRNNNNNLITCDVGCDIHFFNNPYLTCINVDDSIYSTNYWSTIHTSTTYGNIDPQHYFSNNCSGTAIQEHTTNKKLLKVTDILGRETNQPLFYIYDDGTVEKRIVIE